MTFFYTSACSSNIEIILKITIIEVSHITFIFVPINITVNNIIYNTKKNQLVCLYFEQIIINFDIFM